MKKEDIKVIIMTPIEEIAKTIDELIRQVKEAKI
jgi:hypothetical protein